MHRSTVVARVGWVAGSQRIAVRLASAALVAAFLATIGGAGPRPGARAGQPSAAPQGSLYVRQASWAETMLSARKRYLQYRQDQRQHLGRPQAQPFVSPPIAGDGPGMKISVDVSGWRWMRLVTVL